MGLRLESQSIQRSPTTVTDWDCQAQPGDTEGYGLFDASKVTYTVVDLEEELGDMSNHDLNCLREALDVDSRPDASMLGSPKEFSTAFVEFEFESDWGGEMLELVDSRFSQMERDSQATVGGKFELDLSQILKQESRQESRTTAMSVRSRIIVADIKGEESDTSSCSEDSSSDAGETGPVVNRVGAWTDKERSAFVTGLSTFGRNWKDVRRLVRTRNLTQIRTHAQKFFRKVARERQLAVDRDDEQAVRDLTQLLETTRAKPAQPLACRVLA
jgi:SHAQKYF class myb-like DNA-binding protein